MSKHCNPKPEMEIHMINSHLEAGGLSNSCSQAYYEPSLPGLAPETDRGGPNCHTQSRDCVLLICHLTAATECRQWAVIIVCSLALASATV